VKVRRGEIAAGNEREKDDQNGEPTPRRHTPVMLHLAAAARAAAASAPKRRAK
jgi:hypothetical protein